MTYVEAPLNTSSYIDTGITATDTTGFEVDALIYDAAAASGYGCLFGSRVASNSSDFQLTTYTGSGTGYSGTLRRGTEVQNFDAHLPIGTRFTAILDETSYKVDGTSYATSANISSGQDIYIFALNDNGTATQNGHYRLYNLKLYNGSTKIADYIPCKRNSDGQFGLYDIVNSEFLEPTSGLLYGVDTSATSYDSTADYIEFTGAQGVNTGIGISYGNTSVEIQCQVTGDYSTVQIIAGAGTGGARWLGNVQNGYYGVGETTASERLNVTSATKTIITTSYTHPNYYTITLTDGTGSGSTTSTSSAFMPIQIGYGRPGNPYYAKVKIWYVKIYNGNNLVRDLIPVTKGGVGYFYDNVTGLLFGSVTETPLIAGTD